jgi:formylglycine-generating enzyme required for sulfatase activity
MSADLFPEMALIPAGEFLMGSDDADDDERPVHSVKLEDYLIGVQPVTNGEYARFVRDTGHRPPAIYELPLVVTAGGEEREKAFRAVGRAYVWPESEPVADRLDHPVTLVRWNDAAAYCAWLASETGKQVRLPTEAEWEKAARGTDGRIYPWGNDPPNQLRANYGKDKEKWNNHEALVPVGQLKDGKSPYGIYDLAGNVWEWVSDWYDPDYYAASPSRNPQGPKSGKFKVMRGGSWDLAPENLRSPRRDLNIPSTTDYDSPAYRNFNSGFRCAKNP